MADNEAIIPFYINDSLINNLFTIVVQKFAEIKTLSNKSQQVMKITTPLANILENKYVQGNFSIEFLNEFTKQRAEERVSKIITIFLETRSILEKHNLLKKVNTKQHINNIRENDYIEFKCNLNKDPVIECMDNIIEYLEIKNAFFPNDKDTNLDVLNSLKAYVKECRNSKCINFTTNYLCDSNMKAIMPIQLKYMQDNMEQLNNANITVMGKVIKVENNNKDENLIINTYYNYLNKKVLSEFGNKFLKDVPFKLDDNKEDKTSSFIEVLPMAMYL